VVNLKILGTTGLQKYGSQIYEEFLPELRWPRAGKVYQEMADNDSVVGSILYLAEMLIRGAKWSVEAAGKSEEDLAAAKFLESCMNDMEVSWAATITEVLSMMTYGFSLHEIVYKVRRGKEETNPRYYSKYNDGRIGWRCLPIRSQRSIAEWNYTADNVLESVTQESDVGNKVVKIPMSKALLFRTKVSRDNPEGRSLLRNAYRSWFFKKHFEEIEGIGIERDLAGFPVLTAPADMDLWNEEDAYMVALRNRAEQVVSSVRRDSEEGLLLPHGWDLKLLTSSSSRQINIGETINRYDNRIAITMLSDIILIGQRAGSFALAESKQSMLAAALQAQLLNIADVFNTTAVPRLFKYNTFKIEDFPKIVPNEIQQPSLRELALVLRSMGINIAGDIEMHNYFRHLLGMPALSQEVFESVYLPQAMSESTMSVGEEIDTAISNAFTEPGMAYTGGNHNG